ncbi:hypothetical protein QBC40DRAFT_277511 [Triangularia verruculosa]|uniref:Uncharacterized protein n=1 Tax=Triangularia verruculosa TaxID=2587418 RepID=A0AAN7AX71_9PEZI|nr:hypothetical protein QBC40DRAFT_277511 [Triangularia verruculosa]
MLANPAPRLAAHHHIMEMGSFPPAAVGMDHHYPYGYHNQQHNLFQQQQPSRLSRKRKPDAPPENNERLSKRMSLLNLEHSGPKLYVPVEQGDNHNQPLPDLNATQPQSQHHGGRTRHPVDDSMMQLDDSKYKVYIYNLDDELSSSDNETDDGKLIFLPDIEKHLKSDRIPPNLLASPSPQDLADKQLVLYRVPSSITVPEEQDSVRKAIIEARQRMRERQEAERVAAAATTGASVMRDVPMDADISPGAYPAQAGSSSMDDPDAMELD